MTLQQARFSMYNPVDDDEVVNAQLAESEVLFMKDEEGNLIDGCGYTIEKRLDDTHIQLWVRTDETVITAYLEDPRIELIEMTLTCSQCGKEWWGLPTESGLCVECAPPEPEEQEDESPCATCLSRNDDLTGYCEVGEQMRPAVSCDSYGYDVAFEGEPE